MPILEIKKYPDPVLRKVAEPVTSFDSKLFNFLDNMAETMYAENGVGLAAPQVGILTRVVVIDISRSNDSLIELINPEIIAQSGKVKSDEGCLSIPDYRDTIPRSATVTVRAQDRNGKEFEIFSDDFMAMALQHEIDHLNGILFTDHLSRLKRELFKRWVQKQMAGGE